MSHVNYRAEIEKFGAFVTSGKATELRGPYHSIALAGVCIGYGLLMLADQVADATSSRRLTAQEK